MQWVVCTFIPSTGLHIHTLTCSLEVTAQKTISVKPWMGNMRKQIPPITLLSFTNARHLCFLDTIELLLFHMHQNLQQQKVKTHHEQNRLMWNHKFLNWQMINVIWCVQGLNIRHMMFNGELNTKCEMSNSAKPNMFFTMEYLHSSVFRRQTPVSTHTQFKTPGTWPSTVYLRVEHQACDVLFGHARQLVWKHSLKTNEPGVHLLGRLVAERVVDDHKLDFAFVFLYPCCLVSGSMGWEQGGLKGYRCNV